MPHRAQRGFTLIEMLVALTASLILFGAVMTIFQILGDTVGRSRHMSQLNGQLCQIVGVLRKDLTGITANRDNSGLICPVDEAVANGYFELVEGPDSDLLDFSPNAAGPVDKSLNGDFERLVGDVDDMLFFTATTVEDDGFAGRFGAQTTKALDAEIAYFCRPTPNTVGPTLYTLYRRQLLIGPTATDANFNVASAPTFATWNNSWEQFYQSYDLSVRREIVDPNDPTQDLIIQNTLADLQRRRTRLGHDQAAVRTPLGIEPVDSSNPSLVLTGPRVNEDVIAKNVLSFDVKVLDNTAQRRVAAGPPPSTLLEPGDLDYFLPTAQPVASSAATFGDLGFNALCMTANLAPPSNFSGFGTAGHRLEGTQSSSRTYDTWTTAYTTNNIDDDGDGTVDGLSESAPYASRLPAIKITIRLYDAGNGEVSQHTVIHNL